MYLPNPSLIFSAAAFASGVLTISSTLANSGVKCLFVALHVFHAGFDRAFVGLDISPQDFTADISHIQIRLLGGLDSQEVFVIDVV